MTENDNKCLSLKLDIKFPDNLNEAQIGQLLISIVNQIGKITNAEKIVGAAHPNKSLGIQISTTYSRIHDNKFLELERLSND